MRQRLGIAMALLGDPEPALVANKYGIISKGHIIQEITSQQLHDICGKTQELFPLRNPETGENLVTVNLGKLGIFDDLRFFQSFGLQQPGQKLRQAVGDHIVLIFPVKSPEIRGKSQFFYDIGGILLYQSPHPSVFCQCIIFDKSFQLC